MAPTLASALTLSSLGWVSKAFLNLACKDLQVEGLEHLLHALREPRSPGILDKGKGRAIDGGKDLEAASGEDQGRTRRRGVVTSMYSVINKHLNRRVSDIHYPTAFTSFSKYAITLPLLTTLS